MEEMGNQSDVAVGKWLVYMSAAAVCLLGACLPTLLNAVWLSSIPIIGVEMGGKERRRQAYLSGAAKLYKDGHRKFKEGVFRITTSRTSPVLVLSAKYLPELKSLPDNVLNMDAAVDDAMEVRYTKIETSVPIIPHTIKGQLTPSLVRLNPMIAQEVQEALELEMPGCNDWTEINLHHKLLRIIAMVSGRVFIGPELCRTEKYLDAAINYTMEVMEAQRAVQQMRPWLRPLLARSLPQVRRLDQRIEEADAFLSPVVKLRIAASADPSFEKPDDLLQWLIDGRHKFPDPNSQNLAKVQLGISFAAVHTTALTATNVFYNIAAMPELVPEFRSEIRQALAENGGIFTSNALQSLKKMDSFLKETLRVYPATMSSFQRKVLQKFTLSNGQVIPAGAIIEVPAVAINSDPTVFPDPERFDPLRFYRLRERAKEGGSTEGAAQSQFVSVSQDSLTFGYGRHACPGRFFAGNELKMILANALLRYDIKLAEGSTERYPNIEFAHMSIPDQSKNLLFKKLNSEEVF